MKNNIEEKISKGSLKFKIISFVIFTVFLAAVTVALIPFIKLVRTPEGRVELEAFIASYKLFGVFIFVFLQALQVIVAIIPPIQIVGGMLFGGFFGGLLSCVGTMLGGAAVFWLVKLFGKPLVEAIVNKKNIRKFSFFENEERLEHILFILFLIPGVPKDALTYLVPLTKISFRKFMFYVMPSRIPAIMISTFLGSNLRGGNLVASAILLGIFVVLAVFGVLFKDKIVDKLKNYVEKFKNRDHK